MSIKDLFNSYKNTQIQKAVSQESSSILVESSEYIESKGRAHEQFVPPINFTSASTFAKFGSAELYYEQGFKRIYQYYPYDGTLAEKVEFENSSSYIDKHIFDNLYPRTNGYIHLQGSRYVKVLGGPHTASSGMIGKTLHSTFDDSMIYSESEKRTSAFEINPLSGSTVEFWLKKSASVTDVQTIFDVWNGEDVASTQYGRLKIFASGSNNSLRITLMSGTTGFEDEEMLQDAFTDNTWHHFSLSFVTSSRATGIHCRLFKDNVKVYDKMHGYAVTTIAATTNGINATLGADIYSEGTNKLSGSIDEFRFWKRQRTHEEIANTWFVPIGGGTNKSDSNIDLGLYFKFNEGITGNNDLDSTVLDYSGRINNGFFTGSNYTYVSALRNTGSAITEQLSEPEFLDPIIYSSHPEVSSSIALYKTSGSLADSENTSNIFGYFPSWMQETDSEAGNNLKYLSQIIGGYFDNLYHQINYVNKIHDNYYVSGSKQPLPMAKKLLYNKGFVIPDLFVDAELTERLMTKDENEVYEEEINYVKNTIYHNIYNNLLAIYKSKGTEKSFRNFFRSVGINSELVKLKMYADDSTFVLRDNYEYKTYPRKFLNFNYENHFSASIYHKTSSVYGNDLSYIPAGNDFDSVSIETEIILPRKNRANEVGHLSYPYTTSSIFGFHTADGTTDHDWAPTDTEISVYVYKEKPESEYGNGGSQRVQFAISSSGGGWEMTSSYFDYQYENNKWNVAVKFKNNHYPNVITTGSIADNYTVEFYGVESEANIKRNYFHLTRSAGTERYSQSDKRIYAGAHRTNFTGSTLSHTDIKLGYVRYWHSYLPNEVVDQHSYDSQTYGTSDPFRVDTIVTGSVLELIREKTLSLYWDFNQLTSSDGSGEMEVLDHSSGSWGIGGSAVNNYGAYSAIVDRYNTARVFDFPANSSNVLDKNYLYIARKRQPDDLLSSDLTAIKSQETENFFVDDDVSDNFYSFEKSMYGTISEEMLNMFSTVVDFNNLVGQRNLRYHQEYSMMAFLKERFYDDIENEPDLERFTNFYKWIDESISQALQQLVPASSRFSKKINNMVESHVLERNKYVHKVPLVTRFKSTEGVITGYRENTYNWRTGHAPLNTDREDINPVWHRERKEKSGLREAIRNVKNNDSIQSAGLIRKTPTGTAYIESNYRIRRLARTYDVSFISQKNIHGGINYSRDKNTLLFNESIAPAGDLQSVPQNIITVGVGDGFGIIGIPEGEENIPASEKLFFNYESEIGNRFGNDYGHKVKGGDYLPLNLVSGTVHTGYNKVVKSLFRSNVVATNLHSDMTAIHNDVPMQGPFTEANVGGIQYRHVPINKHDTDKTVAVPVHTGGTRSTGSIEFIQDEISHGDTIRVLDSDRTDITTIYSSYYDLLDNRWNTPEELVEIINYKLDLQASVKTTSPVYIDMTSSLSGLDGNVSMVVSTVNITASGLSGGADPTISSVNVNLDGPLNRPEGWGLVFKEHSAVTDTDGAFGFIAADYGGSSYPSPLKLKATRFRDEHAKRPINVKNIEHKIDGSRVGNYLKGYEVFSFDKFNQRRWLREAYDEGIVLPTTVQNSLPNTTNYMTLISQAPYEVGNVFGGGEHSNRHPDNPSLTLLEPVIGKQASGSITLMGREFAESGDKVHFPGISANLAVGINVATGSSDEDFWDNWKSGFESTGYTVTTSSVDRVIGSAINFPNWGSSGYSFVTASDGAYYTALSNAMTISLWFLKPSSSAASGYFFSFASASEDASLNTEPGMVLSAKIGSLNRITFAAGGTYNNNENSWQSNSRTFDSSVISDNSGSLHNLVFTYNGSTTAEGLRLFLNSTEQSATSTVNNLETAPVPLAGKIDGASVFFNALTGAAASNSNELYRIQVSNIAIWNKELSQCEINKLYNNGYIQDLTSSTWNSSSFAGWYKTGQEEEDTFSANAADGLTQYIYLNDYSGRERPLSGSKTGDSALVTAVTSGGTAAKMNMYLTSSLSSSLYNNWETTSSSDCSASLFYSISAMEGAITHEPGDYSYANDIVIPVPKTNLTSSSHLFNTRFSAPGGPEIQSIGYLDAQSSTFSVHNALPFRNLTVLKDSGEASTIRVNDHLNKPRGLKSLLALPMGKFGSDRTYGVVTSDTYVSNGSFIKQHPNPSKRLENSGSSIITGSNYDSFYISSPIPRSEFQYGWINSAISGSNWRTGQTLLGYAPRDGYVSASNGYVPAITFPSASTIYGS